MRSLTTKVVVVAATLAAALAMNVATSTPASADHIGCESGNACIWAGTQWQTDGVHSRHLHFTYYIPNLAAWRYGEQHPSVGQSSYSANNNASSMSNNGNYEWVFFFNNTGCSTGGGAWTWQNGTGDKNLSNGPSGSNNSFSSGGFASYVATC